jgi:hypothetical protein
MARKYSPGSQKEVEKAIKRYESGTSSRIKSRKQAIAVGLEKAREKGYKVPPRKS